MKITVYQDPSGFERLRPVWDDLLQRTSPNLIFMSYRYQRTWWEYLGQGELALMAVWTDDERLVGLAPLFRTITPDGQHRLDFVGCVDVSDYLDLLVDQDYTQVVHQTLLDFLASDELSWDILSLCSLPHTSQTYTHFAETARERGWQVEVQQQDVCPVIILADSWEAYLAGINKKQRHEIRRKMRKLEAETEVRWYVVEDQAGVDRTMLDFVALHQKSAQDKEDFWDEARRQFFDALAVEMVQDGYLKLFFLELNGIKAATLFCFDYDNQFLLYNSGYDPDQFAYLSPGNVLISYTIQEAIRLGRTRYDFLRGDEVYKFRFGAQAEPIYDLEIKKGSP